MKAVLLVASCLVAGVLSAPPTPPHLDAKLASILKNQHTANVIVSFKAGTNTILNTLSDVTYSNRAERLNNVVQTLETHAQFTQRNVLNFLSNGISSISSNAKSLWITNQIYIPNAHAQLIETLLTEFPEISEIAEERVIEIDAMLDGQAFDGHVNRPLNEWGVDKIQAAQVWAMDGGNSGEGVVVANIDTGVRYTHEVLRHNYRGDYGWFDPYSRGSTPIDGNGHGTHTMGTIAGANGIGVAPGATWMACRGCNTNFCQEYALIECGQFMACPTKPDGTGRDCTKAPHLVSNSWGGGQGQSFYRGVVDSWQAAGIVPLFSNGNSGPRCNSANSPADLPNAIGVGSTTVSDTLSSFSSKGPAVNGLIKPDVSAPGSNVYSAWHTNDRAYYSASGTSMACPHAAGAVALILSRDDSLNYAQVKGYLIHGNEQQGLGKTGYTCGGINESQFPNNAYGSGRINALNSLLKLIEDTKHE